MFARSSGTRGRCEAQCLPPVGLTKLCHRASIPNLLLATNRLSITETTPFACCTSNWNLGLDHTADVPHGTHAPLRHVHTVAGFSVHNLHANTGNVRNRVPSSHIRKTNGPNMDKSPQLWSTIHRALRSIHSLNYEHKHYGRYRLGLGQYQHLTSRPLSCGPTVLYYPPLSYSDAPKRPKTPKTSQDRK
ncbi:hypothetical protein BDV95DRAFT_335019 [Massariosphaeria phaeospora]|uniref:Uncharacterized protein n=1 Tax=Massariosphaeria phaeospora TaxID=100035 RepID=A0A7C8IA84_9PLEO|nr:hypothetical protein BDV95DRAFT_335019 [Massariosphaeria phaeospora]